MYTGEGSGPRLYLRPMGSFKTITIPGTEQSSYPFFSPDGQRVAFAVANTLKEVSIAGGSPKHVCEVPEGIAGGDWGRDGSLVVGTWTAGLLRVPVSRGTPEAVTTLRKGEISHRWPQLLPGGKGVLFTVVGPTTSDFHIAVESLLTHDRLAQTQNGTKYARFAATGHLLYAVENSLVASPFDLERLEITGPEVTILDNVSASPNGYAAFALSSTGSLVYADWVPPTERTLVWVDRIGKAIPLSAPPRRYVWPRLSPDGRRLAVGIEDWSKGTLTQDLYTYDLARDVLTQLTFDGMSGESPVWTPDSKGLVYSSHRNGGEPILFKQDVVSGEQARRVLRAQNPQWAGSFSHNGDILAFMERNPITNGDISLLPLGGDGQPQPFIHLPFTQWGAQISPDGHWLAYVSDESGRWEVWVTSFPSGQGRWRVSTEGGTEVTWARNGNELYWRQADKMMAAGVEISTSFTARKPRQLFDGYLVNEGGPGIAGYDTTPDGKFLMIAGSRFGPRTTQLNVILNWFEELRAHESASKR